MRMIAFAGGECGSPNCDKADVSNQKSQRRSLAQKRPWSLNGLHAASATYRLLLALGPHTAKFSPSSPTTTRSGSAGSASSLARPRCALASIPLFERLWSMRAKTRRAAGGWRLAACWRSSLAEAADVALLRARIARLLPVYRDLERGSGSRSCQDVRTTCSS